MYDYIYLVLVAGTPSTPEYNVVGPLYIWEKKDHPKPKTHWVGWAGSKIPVNGPCRVQSRYM